MDFINLMTDMLSTVGSEIAPVWRKGLYDFADHLTFDRDYGKFFQEGVNSREIVKDGLLWCIGTVAVNSTLLCWNSRHPET